MQSSGCESDRVIEWSIEIPEPTGTVPEPDLSDLPPARILHITDIHYDPNYGVGSVASCGMPMCCQAGTVPESPEEGAGQWGDYRDCDTPWHAIEDVLDQIKTEHVSLLSTVLVHLSNVSNFSLT